MKEKQRKKEFFVSKTFFLTFLGFGYVLLCICHEENTMLSGISYQMSFICNLHVECQSYYRSLCNIDASSYGNVVESESSDKRTRTKNTSIASELMNESNKLEFLCLTILSSQM
jgi:hypothetical protein